MAILKTYGRQVQTSADSGAGRAIDTGASQAWGAVGQAVQTVAGVVGDYRRKQDQISTIQGEVKYKSAREVYNQQVSKTLEQAAIDNGGAELTDEQILEIKSPIDTAFYDKFDNEIAPMIKDQGVLAKYRQVIEEGKGEYGTVTARAAYDKYRTVEFINQGKVTAADFAQKQDKQGFENWVTKFGSAAGSDQEIVMRDIYKKAETKVRQGSMYQSAVTSPKQTIDAVNAQIKGEATTWEGADITELKAVRSEAEKQLAKSKLETANNMYIPDSAYQKMLPSDKQAYLDEKVKAGEISVSTYKTESDLIKNPRFIDQTSEMRSDLLNYSLRLRRAGGDVEKVAEILDEANGKTMPSEFKRELNELGTGLLDPNSKYNSGRYKLAADLRQKAFKQEEILPENLGAGQVAMSLIPFYKSKQEKFLEVRDALEINAEYEVADDVNKWLAADGADATPQEVEKYTAQSVLKAKKKYGIPLLPQRMEEIAVTNDVEQETAERPKSKTDIEIVIEANPDWDNEKAIRYLKSIGKM